MRGADNQIGEPEGFRNGPGIRGKCNRHAIEDVVEFAEAVQTAVDNRHMSAHAEGDLGGIRSNDAATEDDDICRSNAGNATQKNAAATVGAFQILRADLDGKTSGDLAHRSKERQGTVALDDGFVGDAGDAGIEKTASQFGKGRQVEIGEERQTGPEERVFGRLGLFDLDDEVGAGPDFGSCREYCGAGTRIFVVGEGAAFAGVSFDENFVARFAEGSHAAGDKSNACFVIFDFFGNAYDHALYGDRERLFEGGGVQENHPQCAPERR